MIFVEVVMWTLLILYYVLTIARLVLHIRDKHKRGKYKEIIERLDYAIEFHKQKYEVSKERVDSSGKIMHSVDDYALTILNAIRNGIPDEEAADE